QRQGLAGLDQAPNGLALFRARLERRRHVAAGVEHESLVARRREREDDRVRFGERERRAERAIDELGARPALGGISELDQRAQGFLLWCHEVSSSEGWNCRATIEGSRNARATGRDAAGGRHILRAGNALRRGAIDSRVSSRPSSRGDFAQGGSTGPLAARGSCELPESAWRSGVPASWNELKR